MTTHDTAPLLDVKGLNVRFRLPTGSMQAVKDVNFSVRAGEVLALVGESGSGKSVTANSLMQLLPDIATITGDATFDQQNLLTHSDHTMRSIRGQDISMIFQEPMTSLNPLQRVGNQIAEVLKQHTFMSRKERRARVISLLKQVGIPEPERRYRSFPTEMSGGQRQRVMIAMALACEPRLLIADEPTTALDVTVQAQILSLLRSLQQQHNMAVIFITHDLALVRHFADSVCVMRHGELVESGRVSEVFAHPEHPYTRQLIDAIPRGSKAPVADTAPVLLEADDIRVSYPIPRGLFHTDHFKAVDGINLTLRKGQTLGIVGESGSGKSTLGRALLRLIDCEGRIVFDGRNISGIPAKAMRANRRDMQVVFQDPYGSLSPRMTVGEIIGEGLEAQFPKMSRKEYNQRIDEVIKEVALDPSVRNRYPHEFSGGQRQRIAIARAVVLKPRFLLLDEPTSALDRSVQARIIQLLRDLQQKYEMTYIFISHDLGVVRALSDTLMVMQNGKVVESGPTARIFESPKEHYTKTLLAAAFLDAPSES